MRNILEKIFLGDVVVSLEEYKETGGYQAALNVRNNAAEEIENRLGAGSMLAADFFGAVFDIAEMAEIEAFQKGFSLAVRLFVEGLAL